MVLAVVLTGLHPAFYIKEGVEQGVCVCGCTPSMLVHLSLHLSNWLVASLNLLLCVSVSHTHISMITHCVIMACDNTMSHGRVCIPDIYRDLC